MLAIIGDRGITRLPDLEISHRQIIRTPYGEPSSALTFGRINNYEIVFLARQGSSHNILPHAVNYCANLWALNSFNPTQVISISLVGGIHPDLLPGMIVIPDQIIDYTHSRQSTYFESTEKTVSCIDFSEPYCRVARMHILEAAKRAHEEIIDGGIYAATQGPRLETVAEINRLERDGADMVGMTGMPEAALARELELCYATIAVVNYCAIRRGVGIHTIQSANTHAVLEKAVIRVINILKSTVELNGN
ncbi:MAG: S-methyl-5'-thioinosine phosphorylase [Nitrosomonadaceae bacterium]|nr:S-methyl-5'-thioinosine phosphorylase [Nitrosomonadaceae bacterium]